MNNAMIAHYLKPNWNAPSSIRAITTLRINGHSLKPYDSFNLADHVGDNSTHVLANRQQLLQELKLINEPKWLRQIHSNKVVCADSSLSHTEADASYTDQKNTVCVVLTADCLPILICDDQGTKVAAIHAGWKGLSINIIENTINELKINPKNLLVWLCPAIGSKAFDVGLDVYEKFTPHDSHAKEAFQNLQSDKWLANIYMLAKQRLMACGIKDANIYGGEYCTHSDSEKFFSYRRDGEKTGRMASLIWLTN